MNFWDPLSPPNRDARVSSLSSRVVELCTVEEGHQREASVDKRAGADGRRFWYLPPMKKHTSTRRSSKGPTTTMDGTAAKSIAERTLMNLELLQQLALAVAANEKAQRRFRTTVLISVSKIETVVQMIHGAQVAELHKYIDSDAMKKHTKDAEAFISQKSSELGLAMVDYIYDQSGEPCQRRDQRQRCSDWRFEPNAAVMAAIQLEVRV